MRIRLVVVGKIKEDYLRQGIEEYKKRLRPFCNLEIIELKTSVRIPDYAQGAILLDETGKEYTSLEFARFMKNQEEMTFIIGDYGGFDDKIKEKANLMSLSKMTFTHEMARLFFMEQLYRVFAINNNLPYHK